MFNVGDELTLKEEFSEKYEGENFIVITTETENRGAYQNSPASRIFVKNSSGKSQWIYNNCFQKELKTSAKKPVGKKIKKK